MRRGRAWKKRARRTATASLPLWARIPRFYIWNNELERAKDAICERPLNLYVCRRGALWLAYHRTQTQSATQWEFLFNPSTDIDSYYSYDTRTRQKCFIRTGYSFQPSIRLNSNGHSKETVPFVPKICRTDIFCKLVKDEHSIVPIQINVIFQETFINWNWKKLHAKSLTSFLKHCMFCNCFLLFNSLICTYKCDSNRRCSFSSFHKTFLRYVNDIQSRRERGYGQPVQVHTQWR